MTALLEDAPRDQVLARARTLLAAQMTAAPGAKPPAPADA